MKNVITNGIKLGCLVLATQMASAAPLPKEGPANLFNCWAGDTPPAMGFSKEYMMGTLAWSGALWNPTPGGPFDAMSGECAGHYEVSPNGIDAIGQCQFADADGDKMLVSIPQNHNGTGTWKFVTGTGKYVGISGGGDFKPLRQFPPALTQGKAVVCNAITGTYKIK
jgi:hypothetical protein